MKTILRIAFASVFGFLALVFMRAGTIIGGLFIACIGWWIWYELGLDN